jgi:hypothetical protein
LGLHGRSLGDNRWAVWPSDDNSFFRSFDLADETGFEHRLDDLLDQVPENDESIIANPAMVEGFNELEEHLAERTTSASDISAKFHKIQLDVLRASRGELAEVVRSAYDLLGRMKVESESDLAFPNRSANLILATDLLIRRAHVPALLFRFDQDPDAMQIIKTLQESGASASYFASQSDWYGEIIGVVHYLGPLLGCMSPRFWCFAASRPMASILFNLGRDIAGIRNSPMEAIQLLPGFGRDEGVPKATLSPTSCRHAIHWWKNRLNQMFGYLLDPTIFKTAENVYDPYEHQHWLLTFRQVFGLTTAVQTSGRNRSVQRALMNTLLDTYAGRILNREFEDLCTWRKAQKTADEVRSRMPADVAEVLMPLADRAVASLQRAQDGFFIQKQRGDANVVIRLPDRPPEEKSPERAIALLLKVFRNATHGFGGKSRRASNATPLIDARLLAHHDGNMPADVVFLPYLYLLEILCYPKRVRPAIESRASSSRTPS